MAKEEIMEIMGVTAALGGGASIFKIIFIIFIGISRVVVEVYHTSKLM